MCSSPQEFSHKTTGEVYTVACRTCNECIATRRHGWVARSMAEKADHAYTICLALTYSDNTAQSRDGAAMFCYADVRDFLKRVRSAAVYFAKKQKLNITPQIRFLCAGEQGDRNGRCHWHMIVYSNIDLTTLGKFTRRGEVISVKAAMITKGKKKRRLNWSLWPHGFITIQEPDQGGMNYVLSYCLKDQFTVEKSKGTARQATAENFATGLFRMSKRPAIGENFLMQKMEKLETLGSVLPSLNITIPDFHGYYQPSGTFRKKMLWALVALNKRALWSTGANAPQWSALLSSCKDIQSDMEILNGLPQKNEQNAFDAEQIERIEFRNRETGWRQAQASFASSCANIIPCRDCLHALAPRELASFGLQRSLDLEGVYQYKTSTGDLAPRDPAGRVNPYCQRSGSKIARLTAPISGLNKAPKTPY